MGSPRAAAGLSAFTIAARTSSFAAAATSASPLCLYGESNADGTSDAAVSDGRAQASGGSAGAAAHSAASAGSASGRKTASNGYAA